MTRSQLTFILTGLLFALLVITVCCLWVRTVTY